MILKKLKGVSVLNASEVIMSETSQADRNQKTYHMRCADGDRIADPLRRVHVWVIRAVVSSVDTGHRGLNSRVTYYAILCEDAS